VEFSSAPVFCLGLGPLKHEYQALGQLLSRVDKRRRKRRMNSGQLMVGYVAGVKEEELQASPPYRSCPTRDWLILRYVQKVNTTLHSKTDLV
jgi:hypothetical protein